MKYADIMTYNAINHMTYKWSSKVLLDAINRGINP